MPDDGQKGDQELIRGAGKVVEAAGIAAMFKGGEKGPGDGPPPPQDAEATRGDDPKQPPPIEEGAAREPGGGPNGPLGGGGAAAETDRGGEREGVKAFRHAEEDGQDIENRLNALEKYQTEKYGPENLRTEEQKSLAELERENMLSFDESIRNSNEFEGKARNIGELTAQDYEFLQDEAKKAVIEEKGGRAKEQESIFDQFDRREAELKEMQEARYGDEADRSDAQNMLANEELAALRQVDYQRVDEMQARGERPSLEELTRDQYADINQKATEECHRNMEGDQDFRLALDRANEQAGAVQEASPEQSESAEKETEQGADWKEAMQEGIDSVNADIDAGEGIDMDMDQAMDADMDMDASAGADIGESAGGTAAEAGAESVASHGAELALSR